MLLQQERTILFPMLEALPFMLKLFRRVQLYQHRFNNLVPILFISGLSENTSPLSCISTAPCKRKLVATYSQVVLDALMRFSLASLKEVVTS